MEMNFTQFAQEYLDGFNVKQYQSDKDLSTFDKKKEVDAISSLITEMVQNGATKEELRKAVKHSMVVLEAEKYHLDWEQSAVDNEIDIFKKKYMEV